MPVFVPLNHISEGMKKGIQSTIQSQSSGTLLSRNLEISFLPLHHITSSNGAGQDWPLSVFYLSRSLNWKREIWMERKESIFDIERENLLCYALKCGALGVVVYVGLNIKISCFCLLVVSCLGMIWGWG